ncbi:hypothetical protein C8J56DRAFT_1039098 [Mycena floridula]|nr:hypothetical protein C8J56DRAFT_1039098 [Mycena floridula]
MVCPIILPFYPLLTSLQSFSTENVDTWHEIALVVIRLHYFAQLPFSQVDEAIADLIAAAAAHISSSPPSVDIHVTVDSYASDDDEMPALVDFEDDSA